MNSTPSPSNMYGLSTEVNRLSIYIYPFTIVLTVVTNIVNIAVLLRRSLRSSSCTHYFLALAIDSLVYVCFTPMDIFLGNRFGLSIDSSPLGCRIHQFFIYSSALFFTCMLVCASLDRFLVSSSSVRLRSFSNISVAQRVIVIVSISVVIYMRPFLLISYWNYNTNRCSQYSTTIIIVYLSSRVILYYIIGPISMLTLGLLIINNIRSQTCRVSSFASQNRHHRSESQLTRVLVIQVGIHLIFSLLTAVTYTIITFIPSIITPLGAGFRVISIIWQQAIFFL